MLSSEVLGKAMEDPELEELRAEPGTLEQRHWERVAWEEPFDESIDSIRLSLITYLDVVRARDGIFNRFPLPVEGKAVPWT